MSASISKDTEHPEEALKFLEFLSRPEIAEIYSNRNNSPSTIKGVEVKSDKIKRLTAILFEGRAFECRITSYNVCYTKLLRGGFKCSVFRSIPHIYKSYNGWIDTCYNSGVTGILILPKIHNSGNCRFWYERIENLKS